MKKSLLAIAAMTAFAGAAQAQSSVTVYGILDVGIMGATNSPNLGGPWVESGSPYVSGTQKTVNTSGQAFGMMSGGESMSRLGFKGSEDLGGGTKAIFALETGFNGNGSIGNGNAGISSGNKANEQAGDTALQGQLFGRAAYAGLSNDKLGTLTAGRQQNLMLDNIGGYDPVNAQLFSPINFSGSYGGGGYTDNSRVTGLKYIWKGLDGFNANAIYAPGGVSGQASAGTSTGAQVGYEAQKWGVQAIASHTTDAQSLSGITAGNTIGALSNTNTISLGNGTNLIAASNAVQVTLSNTTAYMFTAKYQPLDALTLKAGYERENIGTPSNSQLYGNLPTTASGYSVASVSANAYNFSQNVAWAGANYQFTPAIKGSLGYYYVSTLSYAGKIGGGTSQYFSALADYSLSKRTNLYAGVMANNNSASNGYLAPASNTNTAATNLTTTSVTYGIGMRHTF